MKKFAKVVAVIIVIAMLAVVGCGCHEKDEVAYTINGHTFTSAMYSCVLYTVASEARNNIYTFVNDNKGDTNNIKYADYKFDEKGDVSATGTISYNQFVETEAVKRLTVYAVVADEMAKAGITLDKETLDNIKLTAEYYWYAGCDVYTYQQYSAYGVDPSQYFKPYYLYYEPNGVAYSTYEKYMIYEQSYLEYFDHIYGEGGAKEVPKSELTEYLTAHYAIADSISFSKNGDDGKALAADKLTELKAKADKYAERINAGEAFDKIYEEYQKSLQTDSTTTTDDKTESDQNSEANTENTDKEEEYVPEEYLGVYGDKETGYEDNAFAEVHKAELGKAVVFDDTENSRYLLFVRRDITEKEYWLDSYRANITLNLRQDEFDAELEKIAATYTVAEDTHATSPFGVDKIKF